MELSLPAISAGQQGIVADCVWHLPLRQRKAEVGGLAPRRLKSSCTGGYRVDAQHSHSSLGTQDVAQPLHDRCAEAAKLFKSYDNVARRAHSTEVLMKCMRRPAESVSNVHSEPWLASVARMRDAKVRRSTGADPRPVPSWNFRYGGADARRVPSRSSGRHRPKGKVTTMHRIESDCDIMPA
mmetsp:Transcript_7217/g.10082  ORF Transcript_7217/g.10082 Transcript_7217/m.10082 type:complete len:182 (-) Transcript_7217:5-550(-)